MINAELNHNPYLLQTTVKFNGQSPRINSQVEKYEDITLKDWIERVPQIFHDEMNGYDFDLNFTGTKSDFESLCGIFARAGITQEMVRLFHKNELEDAETKSGAIDKLIQWLRDNPNRKFEFEDFYAVNEELFEGAYPYIIINGRATETIHSQVSMEFIKNANELQNTVLTNTPILFFVDPKSTKEIRADLVQVLQRKDVKQNQLFFMIHPQLNTEQVKRVIIDLGVEKPQIVSSYGAEEVLKYFQNYPITEFVRDAIKVFGEKISSLSEILEIENRESEIQNAEIHAVIDRIEKQIYLLKESERFFTDRDNFSTGAIFSDLVSGLKEQIVKWRNRKTKVVGDSECAVAAADYDADIAKYMVSFISATKEAYWRIANEINSTFRTQYIKQGLDVDFSASKATLAEAASCQTISLADEFIALKEITYEEQKYDLMSLFRISSTEKELIRVVTCYYARWREKALEHILPLINEMIDRNIEQLNNYYNELANVYQEHLAELIIIQEAEKDKVSAQLSDDERKLQEDNDWLAEFKEQLAHIERG